jgi:hypothetical protein
MLLIAKKKGTLRWTKGGVVEHIHVGKARKRDALPKIVARVCGQPKFHLVCGGRKPRQDAYDCIQVDPVTKEPVAPPATESSS